MALNSAEVIVANSGSGYIAPVGTALPTADDTALNVAFKQLGYFSEAGATLTIGRETAEVRAWQSRSPLRRIVTQETISIAFEMQQWNRDTMSLALGGGTWSEPTPGHYKFVPALASAGIQAWAFVFEFEDTAGIIRLPISKVEVEGDVAVTLGRDEAAVLPVTLTVLDTGTSDLYDILTDMAQFEVA